MTKHTPGPWRYVDGYFNCEVRVGNKIVLSYEHNPSDENRANARLVAAAPELLEVLERIANLKLSQFMGPHDMAMTCVLLARAAIASATEAV